MKLKQYLQEKISYGKKVSFLQVTIMPSHKKAVGFVDSRDKVYVVSDSLDNFDDWEMNLGKTEKADFQLSKDYEGKKKSVETKEHGKIPVVNISTQRHFRSIEKENQGDRDSEEKIDL